MLRNEIDLAYCESLAKDTEKEKSNEKYKQSKSEQIFNNRENATADTNGKCKLRLIPAPDYTTCNTLLVPPEKLVPPCGFGRYLLNQYFRHTEARPKRFGS